MINRNRDPVQTRRDKKIDQEIKAGLKKWLAGNGGTKKIVVGLDNKPPTEEGGVSIDEHIKFGQMVQKSSPTPSYPQKELDKRSRESVLSKIPRRRISASLENEFSLPIAQPIKFKTSRLRAMSRLIIWLTLLAFFIGGTLVDRIRRRDSEIRRARRLRKAFENAGGTIIKFGQQMAMRIDLLPWSYTVELAKMLDRVPPFPLKKAIEIIEKSLGKPWQSIFAVIDPDPIGSASVACVYHALLKDGSNVAIKVMRPGIGELFMADFKVFDWLLDIAEFLTIIRPGYTQNIRREFKTTLLEELDFIQEARFQDMFRRSAKKTGKRFFTAPRIYFHLCTKDVIVQKYITGIWLREVMAGVEQRNTQALARMRTLNIDPKKVAKRLLWVNYWGMQENLIFHADPHPANVIVGKNSKLSFIDFGSCGSFNREQRAGLEMTALSSGKNDAEGMARGTLKLFEPLPPIDARDLFQQAEAEYTQVLAIFNSRREHTQWWERTSVRQWISFFKFSRDNDIPVTIHTLRMVRATLLYDTIAVRVYKDINRFDEYLKFAKYRESQAKARVNKAIKKNLTTGLDDQVFKRLEEVTQTADKLMYRAQTILGSPMFNFGSLVNKWVFTISILIKFIGKGVLLTAFAVIILLLLQSQTGSTITTSQIFIQVISNRVYQILMGILLFTNMRQILFRLKDEEN